MPGSVRADEVPGRVGVDAGALVGGRPDHVMSVVGAEDPGSVEALDLRICVGVDDSRGACGGATS